MFCPIVGCRACLKSLEDFEDHYKARHMSSCSVCSRVYPTSRLLSIHVSEAHDSFFKAKVARGFAMVSFSIQFFFNSIFCSCANHQALQKIFPIWNSDVITYCSMNASLRAVM